MPFANSILPSQSPSVRQVRQFHSAQFSGAGHLSGNSHFVWTKWKDAAQAHCCAQRSGTEWRTLSRIRTFDASSGNDSGGIIHSPDKWNAGLSEARATNSPSLKPRSYNFHTIKFCVFMLSLFQVLHSRFTVAAACDNCVNSVLPFARQLPVYNKTDGCPILN